MNKAFDTSNPYRGKPFRVGFRARPTRAHPGYYRAQFGFVYICLMAERPEEAQERATRIVEQLPYEVAGPGEVYEFMAGVVMASEHGQRQFDEVTTSGLSYSFICCASGTDEGDFFEPAPTIQPMN